MWRRWFFLLLAVSANVVAAVSVRDDVGNIVALTQPAQRIVALAPHTMELAFAAGGLERIVGKASHSHFPSVRRHIPEIGDNRQIDVERVLALKPDLVIAWRYGVPERELNQLRRRGITVFVSDPRRLDDIASSIVRLGKLLGTEKHAQGEARQWRQKLADMARRYGNRPRLRVFYQVSERPLYTLNDRHVIGEAIQLCGGTNVFGALPTIAPQVNIEAVLAANPQAIISTNVDPGGSGLAYWRRYPAMDAVRRGKLFRLDPDLLDRPGPRMIEGVRALCEALEQAR